MEGSKWLSRVREAPYLGRIHPDTYQFSDIKKLEGQSEVPQMTQVDVYNDGRLVFGYEVSYKGRGEKPL